ncbi:hypothetical protein A9Q91_01975 [Candidatus Gracilibacteria bacterium 28_42_T64]|nr:hypothetical protein A9Q91_01975 [Candidatus Gracilibacteria bacterium 28_42_T64]
MTTIEDLIDIQTRFIRLVKFQRKKNLPEVLYGEIPSYEETLKEVLQSCQEALLDVCFDNDAEIIRLFSDLHSLLEGEKRKHFCEDLDDLVQNIKTLAFKRENKERIQINLHVLAQVHRSTYDQEIDTYFFERYRSTFPIVLVVAREESE